MFYVCMTLFDWYHTISFYPCNIYHLTVFVTKSNFCCIGNGNTNTLGHGHARVVIVLRYIL